MGKTTITCCIIEALRRHRGMSVSPFKVGPDYIDPYYLGAAARGETHTLDSWLMGNRLVYDQFISHSTSDISVIEGVMGYYDGYDGTTDRASTYCVSSITRSPVILILDASKAARSVAATALGFKLFKKDSRIAGVILNRIGSDRHASLCTDALRQAKIPVLGSIPRDAGPRLEERHLGLYSTIPKATLQKTLGQIAKAVVSHIDMDAVWDVACSAKDLKPATERLADAASIKPHPTTKGKKQSGSVVASRTNAKKKISGTTGTKSGFRPVIAVARDSSFNFYYQDNLDALRREGADLVFFSPSSAKRLPACDGLYIGGGFPEVLAAPLERNGAIKGAIKKLGRDGAPIYAECGGLMYLARYLVSKYDKKRYEMVGMFDFGTEMGGRAVLNYTSGMMDAGTPITGNKRRRFRGHEFHYSVPVSLESEDFAMRLDRGAGMSHGRDGITYENTLASYGHLYFDMSDFASNFVANCARYGRS